MPLTSQSKHGLNKEDTSDQANLVKEKSTKAHLYTENDKQYSKNENVRANFSKESCSVLNDQPGKHTYK